MPLADENNVNNCKFCGAPIYWCKSRRTGKAYPVNVKETSSGLAYDRTDFHSKTCTGRDEEISVADEGQEVDTSIPEAPKAKADTSFEDAFGISDVEENASYDNALQGIREEIYELERKAENYVDEYIRPVADKLKENTDTEKRILEEVRQQVIELRKDREALALQKRSFEDELNGIQSKLDELAKEKVRISELKAAQERLDNVRNVLDELWANAPWADDVMDFQKEDIEYSFAAFLDEKTGVLNANDMGLGKTFESGALDFLVRNYFYQEHGRQPRTVWLTKKTLMKPTVRELQKWNPQQRVVWIEGQPQERAFKLELAVENNAIVVINYDALNSTPELLEYDWDVVFMDEVHRLKGGASSNPTKIYQNALKLIFETDEDGKVIYVDEAGNEYKMPQQGLKPKRRVGFLYILSGSPIQNHPKEMWTYLHIFDPIKFPDVNRFEREYCYGWGEGMKVDWERMIRVMKDQVIRRRKDEVAIELPDKVYEYREVEFGSEQRSVYNQMRDRFFLWLDEDDDRALSATAIIAQLTYLRELAVFPGQIQVPDPLIDGKTYTVDCQDSAKLTEAMDVIEELVSQGEQVVVFSSQFNGPLFELERRINNASLIFEPKDNDERFDESRRGVIPVVAETITGKNSDKVDDLQQRFWKGENHVLLINAKVGGEGLNLQCSSNVIFLDLWWNPEFNRQAEDRLYRKGQKNNVTVHIIQAENSVDQFIQSKLDEKIEMIEGIMESQSLRKRDWKDTLEGLI